MCLLHRLCLVMTSPPRLTNQAHQLRMFPLQVDPPHPKTRPPSCSGAGRPGSKKGQAPSMFSGSASRNDSFPPLIRAARKQLFLPWWQVPSWPGRLGAQAPDSRGFFLPPPYPAPAPSPFLAPQAGSCPDTGPTTGLSMAWAADEFARSG